MTAKALKEVMARVEGWPEEAQLELAQIALDMEAGLRGVYHATADELAAIDEALADAVASDNEVESAFAKFRRQ